MRNVAGPTAADIRSARRWGRLVEGIAARYRNPVTGKPLSGEALLLKLAKGESGYDSGATSKAGAHGRTQFMPGTRDAVLKLTGGKVDPWGSVDDAYHAAALHLTGKLGNAKGLEGYNPGDPSYTGYILGQRIGNVGTRRGPSGGGVSEVGDQAQGPADPGQASTAGVEALLGALSQSRQPRPTAGVAAPSFAAQAPIAAGFQVPRSSGGPAPSSGVDELVALAAQVADTSPLGGPDTGGSAQSGGGAVSSKESKGLGPLRELFWQGQGGVNVKNGRKVAQGFVSGHTDHVHVASGPKTVRELGRLAESMGLHVGENPAFGGVNPVHVKDSYHYKGEAIDVSGDPRKMAHFAAVVAHKYGVKVRG